MRDLYPKVINFSLRMTSFEIVQKSYRTHFEARNQDLEARNQDLEARNQDLEARNQDLEARNQDLEARNQDLEARNQDLEARNQDLEARNQDLEARNQDLEAFRLSNSREQIREILFRNCPESMLSLLSFAFKNSKSQLLQDVVAARVTNFEEKDYFVEIGACDGISLSNTYYLEKFCSWNGILVEPAKFWREKISENRVSSIDSRAVFRTSGDYLEFSETTDPMLSTFSHLTNLDHMSIYRQRSDNYPVKTVSLNDLLSEHNAPKMINYLSIDTEGSEWEILSSLNFDEYSFDFISVEHNFTQNERLVGELLEHKGYVRILDDITLFDAWYVKSKLAKLFN